MPADNLPTGVQIAGVFIPVAAAVITGAFVFMNGRKHPSERVKNLAEASKSLPDDFMAKTALYRVIVRELAAIDIAGSRKYRAVVTVVFGFLAVLVVFAVAFQFPNVFRVDPTLRPIVNWLTNIGAVIVGAGGSVALVIVTRSLAKPYNTRLEALKTLADAEVAQAQAIIDGAKTEATADDTNDEPKPSNTDK
jgi:hypothetical protein